jgi:hypothetical protein
MLFIIQTVIQNAFKIALLDPIALVGQHIMKTFTHRIKHVAKIISGG